MRGERARRESVWEIYTSVMTSTALMSGLSMLASASRGNLGSLASRFARTPSAQRLSTAWYSSSPPSSMTRSEDPPGRQRFSASFTLQSRVQDTDLMGHINNTAYYAYMDTAICTWSANSGDNLEDNNRFVAETGLRYHLPAKYPDPVEVCFGTKHIGNSSVEYAVAMFNSEQELLADGKFVHVYVSKEGRPHRIPDVSRKILESIALPKK